MVAISHMWAREMWLVQTEELKFNIVFFLLKFNFKNWAFSVLEKKYVQNNLVFKSTSSTVNVMKCIYRSDTEFLMNM